MALDLTEEQLIQYRAAFSVFEKEVLNCKELCTVIRVLGLVPVEAEMQDALNTTDADGKPSVDLHGFLSMMADKMKNTDNEAEVKEAFRMFDKDGNGFISTDDLKMVMASFGDKMTEEEIEEMVADAGAKAGGLIKYEDFVTLMFSK